MQDQDFLDIIKDCDICFLSECWLNQQFDQDNYDLNNFKTHYFRREKCKGGGLFLMYNEKFAEFIKVEKVTADSLLWIKISNKLLISDSDLYLCFAYIPPEGSLFYTKYDIDLFDAFLNDLELYAKLGSTACIGDFNSRIGSLEDHIQYDKLDEHVLDLIETCFVYPAEPCMTIRKSADSYVNSNGRRFVAVCQQSGLRVLN